MHKIMIRIITIISICVLLANITMAFSSQYLPDNTLEIPKGGEGTFRILLQNPDDYPKIFIIDYHSNITTLSEDNNIFLLKPKTNKEIFLIIKPPKDTEEGSIFPVSYQIGESSAEETQNTGTLITMGSSIPKSFIVRIGAKIPSKITTEVIATSSGALVFLIILGLIIWKTKPCKYLKNIRQNGNQNKY